MVGRVEGSSPNSFIIFRYQGIAMSSQLPTDGAGSREPISTEASRVVPQRCQDLSRRSLLLGGSTILGATAVSYARVLGANDRICLGQIGVGNRGRELASVVAGLKSHSNVEMIAVCDLWKVNRDRAAATAANEYGRRPLAVPYPEELVAAKDVDAVIVSNADFQHATHLRLAVEAGKDVYCEKPMATDLREAKAARDAVRSGDRIVQVGTQHRSEPYQAVVRDLVASGALGCISKVEIVWNYNGPRWRGRPEVRQIREEDTDWQKWLLTKPPRAFDPRLYFEFRLYREFSSGIADQWMSHASDMVHYLMDDPLPKSVVAHGGVFAWHDGRENPDTFQALFEYPKGFLVSYSTSLGNDSDSFSRFMGKKATLINHGGEGSRRWKLVEERGTHEANPFVRRPAKYIKLSDETSRSLSWNERLWNGAVQKTYGPLPFTSDRDPSHMKNWLECLRSRKQPNATVDHGFAHSVAVIMAARAYETGQRLYFDPVKEEILDRPPMS